MKRGGSLLERSMLMRLGTILILVEDRLLQWPLADSMHICYGIA